MDVYNGKEKTSFTTIRSHSTAALTSKLRAPPGKTLEVLMQQTLFLAIGLGYGPITSFKVGQYVLIEYPNIMRSGPENKLLPTLKGPAKVIAKADNSRYKVEDLVTRRAKDYHISALRPYNMDLDLQRAPLFYAIRDHTDHFLVEKITAHKGKPSSKSRMTFQVHWVGYSEPTWEPWNKISRTLALYQYLKNHAIKALQKITPNVEVEDIVMNDSTTSSNEGMLVPSIDDRRISVRHLRMI